MYYGMMFTTFCWHNEDNNLYSINYNHKGSPKLWYGIPGSKECADGLEKVFKGYLSMKMREVPDLLHHITTMFSPRLLQNAALNVSKLVQYEGEFIVTFPRAFHGGLSLGPNIGEAVNFATSDWISYGSDANERYRSLGRPSVFSHDRLCFTMANHLQDQKSSMSCKLLLIELQRIVDEELKLRAKLRADGVRDVSSFIRLPKNRLDQLDDASASYDDKRLCHACKHVCFFAAVACECSQSKVSCLRHSHFMCRCPAKRKYFMFWCSNDEMTYTVEKVKQYCQGLENVCKHESSGTIALAKTNLSVPGVSQDILLHKRYDMPTNTIVTRSFETPTFASKELLELNAEGQSSRSNPDGRQSVGEKRCYSQTF
jgi:JmjC domain, hydroxylase/C5HC2 zinc finger